MSLARRAFLKLAAAFPFINVLSHDEPTPAGQMRSTLLLDRLGRDWEEVAAQIAEENRIAESIQCAIETEPTGGSFTVTFWDKDGTVRCA